MIWHYEEASGTYQMTTPRVWPDRRNINGTFVFEPNKQTITFFYKEVKDCAWTGRYIASESVKLDEKPRELR